MFLKEYRIVYEKCFNSFDRRYLNRIIQNPVVTIEKLRNLARLPMMENLRKIIGIFYYNPNCTFKLWKCLRKIFRTEAKLIFGESIVYNNEIDFHPDLWASVNVNKVVEEEKLGSQVEKWIQFFNDNHLIWHPIILKNKIVTFDIYR